MTIFAAFLLATQVFFAQAPEFQELPHLEITAADIIAVAVEYTILKEDNPVFCRQFYGMTDYLSRTITICTLPDTATQRRTLLHEIVHVVYWQRGINTGGHEHAVENRAAELYLQLYGISGAPKETKTE